MGGLAIKQGHRCARFRLLGGNFFHVFHCPIIQFDLEAFIGQMTIEVAGLDDGSFFNAGNKSHFEMTAIVDLEVAL
jgi:hypothetical protein